MDHVLRGWICKNCGSSNESAVAPDGVVKCESCTDTTTIESDEVRGGQTPALTSGPSAASTEEGSIAVSAPSPLAAARQIEKRQVIARLRERYGVARALVSSAEPYANLDWILGPRRNREKDDAAVGADFAELMVLWLQDLASELESAPVPRPPDRADEGALAADASRHIAGQSLRAATKEFAVAFLSPYA